MSRYLLSPDRLGLALAARGSVGVLVASLLVVGVLVLLGNTVGLILGGSGHISRKASCCLF